ncbi:ABC transporter permease [Terriglobus saanensis]|uniref:Permease n=1 Tax=Terriglobus saanensis (strain ATCC BAA-1853 / DSM 23119 / SP1PR4) TaxID=401053 RepID=E8UY79_TERSS|nr:ABC transporter permease [Terriglobus saanensis]ADV80889.1 permease [Terriglobus saanensis SP1PR4]
MLKEWLTRLRFLMSPKPNREIDEELQFHIERQAQEYIAAGMTPQEAHRKAVVAFGGIENVRAQSHKERPSYFLGTLLQDVRYALRQLRKSRSFTVTAVLTLSLGIGANAAIFTLVNAVLLKNLPVVDPSTLVRIGNTNECCVNWGAMDDGNYSLFATDDWHQLQRNAPEFEELAAMQSGIGQIIARRDKTQESARPVSSEFVSGNYFRTFGLKPQIGRLFTDADNVEGAPFVAVMSYDMWQNNYAGDPSVVGSTFWVNTKAVTITGIAPKGFYGDRLSSTPPDLYLPIESMPVLANAQHVHIPDRRWLYLIGRVKPGVAMAPLQAKISELVRQSFAATTIFSDEHGKRALAKVHVVLSPGGAGIQDMQDSYASKLKLLMWISGLVLLIACANIANLLLVRGMNRRAEMSVRTALGAMRTRIVRQLLTESIVLSIISGIVGLIVAYAGTRMLLAMAFPGAQAVPIDASPSGVVLAFAFGVSLLTGILFGVAPAWITSKANPADALRSGTRTTTSGASLLQRSLIVLQSALALVLLVGAGMFIQSLNKLRNIDLKLNSTNRYIIHFNPQAAGYSPAQVETLYRTIEERFHAIPGVQKVGISAYTPMEADNWGDGVQIQGQPDHHNWASWVRGNAEYLDSVGTHVLIGRGITTQDTSTSPAVAVVNQSFVQKFFKPGENPVGRRFGSPGPVSSGDFEIVGVVEDTAYNSATWKNHAMYFIPMTQRIPESARQRPIEKDTGLYAGAIVIHTERPMDNIQSLARQTLAAINPNLSVVKFQTFDEQIADRFTQDRMVTRLMTLFSILALLLATLGLYGVTSYTVARRTSEIGIRMALGANRSSVVGMIMRGAMLQTAIGLAAIGIPVAWFCVRYIESQLYETKGMSLAVLTIATLTLTAAAAAAGLIPAQRAASTNPSQALRTE